MATPVTWSPLLPQFVNMASFGINKGSTVLRSDTDIGPQKVRARFTKGVDQFQLSMTMPTAQYLIFDDFFNVELNGGATPFYFVNPVTQVMGIFRFTAPFQVKPIGGNYYEISMTWELLP